MLKLFGKKLLVLVLCNTIKPFGVENRILWSQVNTMVADTLAPWVTMTSADMVSNNDNQILVFYSEEFQLPDNEEFYSPVSFQYWEIIENANIFLYFLK